MIKKDENAKGMWKHLANDHIDTQIELRKTQDEMQIVALDENATPQDDIYLANKIKNTFKRSTDEGLHNKCWKIVEVPLNFLRDYTVPMAEKAEWDRTKASILPFFLPWAFCFLQGMFTIGDDSVDFHQEAVEEETDS